MISDCKSVTGAIDGSWVGSTASSFKSPPFSTCSGVIVGSTVGSGVGVTTGVGVGVGVDVTTGVGVGVGVGGGDTDTVLVWMIP